MLQTYIQKYSVFFTIPAHSKPVSFFTLFLLTSFQSFCQRTPGAASYRQCMAFYEGLVKHIIHVIQTADESQRSSFVSTFQSHYNELLELLHDPLFPVVKSLLHVVNTILLNTLSSLSSFTLLKAILPLWGDYIATMFVIRQRANRYPFHLPGTIVGDESKVKEIIKSWQHNCCHKCGSGKKPISNHLCKKCQREEKERQFYDQSTIQSVNENQDPITCLSTSSTTLSDVTIQSLILNSISLEVYCSESHRLRQAYEARSFFLSELIFTLQLQEQLMEQSQSNAIILNYV